MPETVAQLKQLASGLVGDGQRPNVFFVSSQGVITLVTADAEGAYAAWASLADCWERKESALEDRLSGVLCDVSAREEESGALVVRNDFGYWRRTYSKEAQGE